MFPRTIPCNTSHSIGRHRVTAGRSFRIMKEYAKGFYKSAAWKACRKAYAESRRGLCEVCLARGLYVPGEIVHHRVHLTPDNINDPAVSLNWNNLQLVCRECHAQIHAGRITRYKLDRFGRVIVPPIDKAQKGP